MVPRDLNDSMNNGEAIEGKLGGSIPAQCPEEFAYRAACVCVAVFSSDWLNFNFEVSREIRFASSFIAVSGFAPERTICWRVAAHSVVDWMKYG